jgi:3-dehydrosphinganine reductase
LSSARIISNCGTATALPEIRYGIQGEGDVMFDNKLIVITGGSSGLGKALAERFARMGASMALIARDPVKLEKARGGIAALSRAGRRVEIFPCDVSDHRAAAKTFDAIAASLGSPDMLINSAGILKEGYFELLPPDVFRQVMDINYFGALHCTMAAMKYFRARGEGTIVNIASLGGRIASFWYTAYCSSKFALVGLTETLRCELTPRNIRIHLVCPGEFDSPMVDELNTYRTIENRVLTQTAPVLPLDRVADETIAGIRKGRYLIIPGRASRFLDVLARWFPASSRMIVDRRIRKVYRGPSL